MFGVANTTPQTGLYSFERDQMFSGKIVDGKEVHFGEINLEQEDASDKKRKFESIEEKWCTIYILFLLALEMSVIKFLDFLPNNAMLYIKNILNLEFELWLVACDLFTEHVKSTS